MKTLLLLMLAGPVMADTWTPNFGFRKPTVGVEDSQMDWSEKYNRNFDIADSSMAAAVYNSTITSNASQFSGTGAGASPLTLLPSSVTLQGNTNVALLSKVQSFSSSNTFQTNVFINNGHLRLGAAAQSAYACAAGELCMDSGSYHYWVASGGGSADAILGSPGGGIGVYQAPSAVYLQGTAGANRMAWKTDTGRLGLGTTSPIQTLHVVGGGHIAGSLTVTSSVTVGAAGILFNDGTVLVSTSGLGSGGGASQWTTSGSTIYYNSGLVAIGTTTAQAMLNVHGSGSYGLRGIDPADGSQCSTCTLYVFPSALLRNTSDGGDFGLAPSAMLESRNVFMAMAPSDAGGYTDWTSPGAYQFFPSGGQLRLGQFYGTSDMLIVDGPTQRIGIFQAAPQYSLDVTGTVRSTATITTGTTLMGREKISNTCNAATSCTADCSAGKRSLGGGCVGGTVALANCYPSDDDTWTATTLLSTNLTVYNICARMGD